MNSEDQTAVELEQCRAALPALLRNLQTVAGAIESSADCFSGNLDLLVTVLDLSPDHCRGYADVAAAFGSARGRLAVLGLALERVEKQLRTAGEQGDGAGPLYN